MKVLHFDWPDRNGKLFPDLQGIDRLIALTEAQLQLQIAQIPRGLIGMLNPTVTETAWRELPLPAPSFALLIFNDGAGLAEYRIQQTGHSGSAIIAASEMQSHSDKHPLFTGIAVRQPADGNSAVLRIIYFY